MEHLQYPGTLIIDVGDALTRLVEAVASNPYYTKSSMSDPQSPLVQEIDRHIEACVELLTGSDESLDHLEYMVKAALELSDPGCPVPDATYALGCILHESVAELKAYPHDAPFPYYYSGRQDSLLILQFQENLLDKNAAWMREV